jgi:hypothetical protein
MLIVLILFTIARLLGGGRPGELSRRQRRRVRRAAAQASTRGGAVMLSAGLALPLLALPLLAVGLHTSPVPAHSGPAARPLVSTTQPVTGSGGATTASTPPGGRTVRGPQMWDPKTHRQFARRSAVTVSQVTELTNQVVRGPGSPRAATCCTTRTRRTTR